MEQPQHRFHGKVLVRRGDTEVHVNVFDDNREVVYLEIQKAIAQFSGDIKPAIAAYRDIAQAEQSRAAAAPTPVPKSAAPTRTTTTKAANPPVCEICNMADMVELISWTDKKTGERKKAWKCQRCKEWLYTNQKQPARALQF